MLAVGATTCGVPPVLRTAALDALVARAAGADPRALVLILGEPGVGKDILARLIHTDSARRLYPFIKMNCALEPVDRCEAELFGVERGASPPAIRRRLGALEFANHGAIYLDKLERLPPAMVPRLLQALKSGEVSRVGARAISLVDLRVIASSTVDCVGLRGLDTVQITIPPLRQRPDEICSFASFFVEQFNRQYQRRADLCPDTVAKLRDHLLAREPARARGNGASSRGQRSSPGLRIERIACVEGPARQHSAHVCTLSWKLPISMEVSGSVRDFTVDPELPTQPVFCAVGCTEHRQKFSVQDSLHQAPFLCERALVRRLPS